EARDTAELPEASGEAIAREFERYLRRRDGGGPPGHATDGGRAAEGEGPFLREGTDRSRPPHPKRTGPLPGTAPEGPLGRETPRPADEDPGSGPGDGRADGEDAGDEGAGDEDGPAPGSSSGSED
ncbi:hypothetical protein G6W47_28130, partial [Streptomyces sp. CAI-21]|nr:hypothetical protein [Streptomyces sp. CAI-21]